MIKPLDFKFMPVICDYCIFAEMPDGINWFVGLGKKQMGKTVMHGVVWDTNPYEIMPFPNETLANECLEKLIDFEGANVGILLLPLSFKPIIKIKV